jgi:hypothetical protein
MEGTHLLRRIHVRYLAPHTNTETECPSPFHDIPSWSWMAYSGGIEFVKVSFVGVSWIKPDHLQFNQERTGAVTASLGEILGCTTRPCENCIARLCETRHELEEAGEERGWVQYDFKGNEKLDTIQCAIIGSKRATDDCPAEYYILLVRPTGADGEYKRVGVRQVQSGCVARQRKSILLV